MTLIVTVALLTLGASFLCSLLEAALYSVTMSQLDVLQRNKVFGARRFARFRARIDAPIAAILTINTIAHTVGALVLGALVEKEFGQTWLFWFTVVFTLLVLFATEIVPKSVGVKFGRQLVPVLAWPLQVMVWISWPVASICSWLMRKLTGHGPGHIPTEAEIISMSKAAGTHGEVTALEARLVENVLVLDQKTALDLVTPRTVIKSVVATETVEEVQQRAAELVHSRLPVTEKPDALDEIVGVIHRRDVQAAVARGEGQRPVRDYMRQLDIVPRGMRGPQLLDKFISGRKHMVLVVDEYGGIEGIVTLEDVLEEILGREIVDEHDQHVDMQEVARSQAKLKESPPRD